VAGAKGLRWSAQAKRASSATFKAEKRRSRSPAVEIFDCAAMGHEAALTRFLRERPDVA